MKSDVSFDRQYSHWKYHSLRSCHRSAVPCSKSSRLSLAPDSARFNVLCPTRWTVRADSLKYVISNYGVLQELWDAAKSDTSDHSMRVRIYNWRRIPILFAISWAFTWESWYFVTRTTWSRLCNQPRSLLRREPLQQWWPLPHCSSYGATTPLTPSGPDQTIWTVMNLSHHEEEGFCGGSRLALLSPRSSLTASQCTGSSMTGHSKCSWRRSSAGFLGINRDSKCTRIWRNRCFFVSVVNSGSVFDDVTAF